MTRKEFLKSMVTVVGGVWIVKALAGCSSDSNNPNQDGSPTGNCAANGTSSAIAFNHGHVLMVSQADVTAGVQRSYDIVGTADHTHTVTLTGSHFSMLAQNNTVNVISTVGGTQSHQHSITVMCA